TKHRSLTETALASVMRGGVWMTMYAVLENQDPPAMLKDFNLDKHMSVSDFKLGKKEPVSGKEAQVIEYKLNPGADELVMSVWIDVRTLLPLKRVVKGKPKVGPYQVIVTETYTKAAVDEKVDDKDFEIPK
ncbi:MAG TPA: hypothetical protein VKD72_29070, partial [Gemmataceae bacterium]|nr:hypothetical protein [Gemmataceae bacterium]